MKKRRPYSHHQFCIEILPVKADSSFLLESLRNYSCLLYKDFKDCILLLTQSGVNETFKSSYFLVTARKTERTSFHFLHFMDRVSCKYRQKYTSEYVKCVTYKCGDLSPNISYISFPETLFALFSFSTAHIVPTPHVKYSSLTDCSSRSALL